MCLGEGEETPHKYDEGGRRGDVHSGKQDSNIRIYNRDRHTDWHHIHVTSQRYKECKPRVVLGER